MKLIRPKTIVKQKLICYVIEIANYKHFYSSLINVKEAKTIIKLLAKHFKIKIKEIDFNYKSKWYGGWAFRNGKLKFRKEELNLGIVCHEVCHLFCYKKKIYGHPNKFYYHLTRFVNFIENNLEFTIKIK